MGSRPSAKFPTLELRITDICPLIDDAVCIAVLFRCLCRCLCRQTKKGPRVLHPLLLLNENRWRAQRYGLEQGFLLSGAASALHDGVRRGYAPIIASRVPR